MKITNIIITTIITLLNITASPAQSGGLPVVRQIDENPIGERESTVKICQLQIDIPLSTDTATLLPVIESPYKEYSGKIKKCLNTAREEEAEIIIFPELASCMKASERERLISIFRDYAKENDAIIIAGTYYADDRTCIAPVIFPDTIYHSYKLRPSIFESSIFSGKGMKPADTLCVYKTRYGNLVPLVCVDLISDDANYTVRRLSNRGLADILISICYNPASREFLREASSITNRHPLFAIIANSASGPGEENKIRSDSEYGLSAIIGSLHPMQRETVASDLPDILKDCTGEVHDAYQNVIAVTEPQKEAALSYELNLSVIRVPMNTNAPDQGYPTIKNIKHTDIK